ncbi:hypothetical protein [Mycolicibacterium sphagni]|uniref:hypothetical protein n=1 Tax=Mycolicibacterium sphagni TaxID=1786 RepID=UPI001576C3FC|nr:hypothetical protein [Mycolicibacterium sphagni]
MAATAEVEAWVWLSFDADADGVTVTLARSAVLEVLPGFAALLCCRAVPAVPRDESAGFVELLPDDALPSSALATAGAASSATPNPVAAVPI